ncbi:uncharacterized protein RJT20DRAFT_41498 [Scheffersomyces xylosifermentans]|uniref:uncharacterized protein n=1 Tax=Scheffersomyces xylosifermentans TaxID=1304137 RepID=UPI00315D79F1
MSFDEPINDPIAIRGPQRVFQAQLVFCSTVGILSFVLFCILRYRWPHIYAVRTLRKSSNSPLKPLPRNYFGWISVIHSITDDEILNYSGLDAYVYLEFFKMGIKVFFLLTVIALAILSPVRYYFTGNYDKDNIPWRSVRGVVNHYFQIQEDPKEPPDFKEDFPKYLWIYTVFTYLFSIIVYYYLLEFTKKVLKMRQKYLASQNSITDRTIRLDGIPKKILKKNDPQVLKRFIEDLGIGKVVDVKLMYDWTPMERLFKERRKLLNRLEDLYASNYDLKIDVYSLSKTPSVIPNLDSPRSSKHSIAKTIKKDKEIDELSKILGEINQKIKDIQDRFDDNFSTINLEENPEFKQIPSAFITMETVASAQMAAQAVLDPRVYKMMVTLAPAPKDIRWENLKMSYIKRLVKSYLITFVIILSYAVIIFLVVLLTSLLDLKSIIKFWPALGKFIGKSKPLTTFVTGILPPLLFSALSVSVPYFYKYLCEHQGYSSNSEIELSTLSKNFFFNFFILFLAFMTTGTIWDYLSYISDTTKIAKTLASALKKYSLFYVDLILLQGLAMFPVKLLQISDFLILNILAKLFLLRNMFLKTPRDYRSYYFTPQVFDFGIHLPQHIFIFMIILIYSVVSTKIVTSGLVYFILGWYVYKYQLVYNFVHPPHSTGKVWPMIFRRVILGLVIFQLFMCGTLALEKAILLALLCSPLVVITLFIFWNFERFYVPLNSFIALRAIKNPYNFEKEFDDDRSSLTNELGAENETIQTDIDADSFIDESSFLLSGSHSVRNYENSPHLSRRRSTIDEEREQFTDYTYPYLVDPLNGPWVGFEGNVITMAEYTPSNISSGLEDGDSSIVSTNEREVFIRKRITVSEWE